MKYWQTQEFKNLQETWYAKAEDSGFKSLETSYDMQNNIIRRQIIEFGIHLPHLLHFKRIELVVSGYELKFEGDRYLGGFYKDETDVLILNKHREGLGCREIQKVLEFEQCENKKIKALGKSQIATRLNNMFLRAGIEPAVFK